MQQTSSIAECKGIHDSAQLTQSGAPKCGLANAYLITQCHYHIIIIIIIIILFAQIMSIQIHWRQYKGIQSVSKTYQAHTSSDGSLIITSNILR